MAEQDASIETYPRFHRSPIAEIILGGFITTAGNILLEDSLTAGIALGLGGIAVMGHGLHRFDRPSQRLNGAEGASVEHAAQVHEE